ncbi:MAG: hypothetical protein ACLVIR_12900 [Clostridium sp.]
MLSIQIGGKRGGDSYDGTVAKQLGGDSGSGRSLSGHAPVYKVNDIYRKFYISNRKIMIYYKNSEVCPKSVG